MKQKKQHTCPECKPECKNSSENDDPFLCTICLKIDNSNRFNPSEFLHQNTKYRKFEQAVGVSCDDCYAYLGSFFIKDSYLDFDPICKTCEKDFLSMKDTVGFFCSKCRGRKRWKSWSPFYVKIEDLSHDQPDFLRWSKRNWWK